MLKGHGDPELAHRISHIFAEIGHMKVTRLLEEEIRALGDHCVMPLTHFIDSPDGRKNARLRRKAARLLADIAVPWTVPYLIRFLEHDDGEVRFHVAQALERLTGNDFRCEPSTWQTGGQEVRNQALERWYRWIQENAERYPPPPGVPRPMK
jgi:HEAT repeat protein